jgi:hypothetical protein
VWVSTSTRVSQARQKNRKTVSSSQPSKRGRALPSLPFRCSCVAVMSSQQAAAPKSSTPVSTDPGVVVWVKFSKAWWSGRVRFLCYLWHSSIASFSFFSLFYFLFLFSSCSSVHSLPQFETLMARWYSVCKGIRGGAGHPKSQKTWNAFSLLLWLP